MTFLLFFAGLALLIIGAEALVRGASRIAFSSGVSPLVIGLTVVAFGTSAPELAVSVKAALSGQSDIALGNVIGSNIFNVLFILGVSALVTPLIVSQQLVRLDVPVMIGVSVLCLILAVDRSLGVVDGLVLVLGLAVYLWLLLHQSRREQNDGREEPERDEVDPGRGGWLVNALLVVSGLAMLILGSRWLVDTAVVIAEALGVSELVIGLTIVAAGTSLPEVMTSVVASLRGERDIAVGNVVGSNIFNIMAVLGISSMVAEDGIEVSSAVIGFDLPVMIVVAFACLPIFFTGGAISRWEGGLLLAYYAAYTAYLILAASQHDALPEFSAVMLYFAIPLTLVTLVVVAAIEIRKRSKSESGRRN
ncbi:MAG TPA: calcium/sodium antiporter [Rhodothermia bacterium]|nr:calcium/sodium antiporter [Rhodothermia bacterium]